MKIAFDPALGIDIGYGHIKRCESIAEEMINLSAEVDFIIRDKTFDYLINKKKFGIVQHIPEGTRYSIIVIDRYDVTKSLLRRYRKLCNLLVRVDDGSTKILDDRISDVVINGNPYARKGMYEKLVKKDCLIIAGPEYIPMSRKFYGPKKFYRIRPKIKKILIIFGGSEIGVKYAKRVYRSLIKSRLNFNLIISSPVLWPIRDNSPVSFIAFTDKIDKIMLETDLAITSSGSICWQLATVGVPFIACKIALNQSKVFNYIKQKRLGVALPLPKVNSKDLNEVIKGLNYSKRKALWKHSRSLIDHKGSARIARILLNLGRCKT